MRSKRPLFVRSALPFRIMAPSKQRRHLTRLAAQKRKASTPTSQLLDVPLPGRQSESDTNETIEGPDSWIFDIEDNDLNAISGKPWLEWKDNAGLHIRKPYNGYGRSSKYAKQAEKRRRVASAAGCRSIQSYFEPSVAISAPNVAPVVELEVLPDDDVNEPDSENGFSDKALDDAINKLNVIVQLRNNALIEKRSKTSKFDFIRHLCILRFLKMIKESPRTRIKSSIHVAQIMFGDSRSVSKARSIRKWSYEYVKSHRLMLATQGKHKKSESLIDDPDIRRACLSFLRSVRPDLIDGHMFAKWVIDSLHQNQELSILSPVNIHVNTALRWMHVLGFRSVEHKKGTYTDGHERPDVVAYRKMYGL